MTGRDWRGPPIEALVNRDDPEQRRGLMDPLATVAGGWGQDPVQWHSKEDPGYRTLRTWVLSCIQPLEYADVNGTRAHGSLLNRRGGMRAFHIHSRLSLCLSGGLIAKGELICGIGFGC